MDRLHGGAVRNIDHMEKLRPAGFADVDIEPTRTYNAERHPKLLCERAGTNIDAIADQVARTS